MTPWAVACQAPLSMGFSRQEYWSGLPFPSPGDHPDPGIEFMFLASLVLAGGFLTTSVAWEAPVCVCIYILYITCAYHMDFSGGSDDKESACNAGNPNLIPGSG